MIGMKEIHSCGGQLCASRAVSLIKSALLLRHIKFAVRPILNTFFSSPKAINLKFIQFHANISDAKELEANMIILKFFSSSRFYNLIFEFEN